MSFVKPRRNPVIAVSTNMTNSVARCCVPPVASLSSVSSSGNSTRLAVNLPHRTSGTADMPHISTMLGALSCSEDMRLLSPVSSTSLSHANGGSESRAGHLTSLSNLSYHARNSQGNHQQSSVSPHPDHLTCVNNGDGVYNSKGRISGPGASASMSDDSNTTCCGAHCGSSRSTCAMYEMSESSNDYECHLSNPEAICSPLLGTSNIWRFESSAVSSTFPGVSVNRYVNGPPVDRSNWKESSLTSATELNSSTDLFRLPLLNQVNKTTFHDKIAPFSSRLRSEMDSSQLLDILEDVARRRRSSLINGNRAPDPMITWKGVLQPKEDATGRTLSRKVFVGGLSRDMDSRCLLEAFQSFGVERIEWYPRAEKGFAYAIFRRESRLRMLLNVCSRDAQGRYYFKVGTLRPYRERQVQLIPWLVDDSDQTQLVAQGARPEVNEQTVFVGALHGEMTAKDLAIVMQKCFGVVLSVGLDTDKFKYPCGTARVTFQHPYSQVAALVAGYIRVESNKFAKTLQIDPFLQDFLCAVCKRGPGPVFCRHYDCFTYFCPPCFFQMHNVQLDAAGKPVIPQGHEPLTKNRVIKKRHDNEQ
ncbi:cytoplasmic polyadenylation element-binding protein 3-like isoform X1 [Varroa jacobsoni]|uniref:cytoplasmic polyadenylation element-binding protein 3-like isoform X1 n=2 Tax=Varroa jacobsoni TaxID=62625 RepID=UPI000BF7989A|nr:cytoplasmic polyadenylation element-binding protein 3-like isoform X1 [Varroa jacobsoni]